MRKYLLSCAVFVLAFGVFSVSVMRSAAVSYSFAATVPTPTPTAASVVTPQVDYQIPFIGNILPDSPLWSVKALRDWLWYRFTFDHLKKAELALLFSDKRLIASKVLFENKKPGIALSTLTKGEKYLEISWKEEEIARNNGQDTTSFLTILATSSLKHKQVIEETLKIVPEDVKPEIIKVEDYANNTYKSSRDALNHKGIVAPKDPFNGQ